ncbi:Flp pilus assembly protein CpaB [uncultured Algimonas sp.]|uniref:Flp pilus assembly protein CpaB n=1 Tax=uncultured Algimonas sp. TaxID=1547920 RepID=UPI0026027D01|nr:Flp pilus assembly protein CpaB [uncultured Algimonas sp.]
MVDRKRLILIVALVGLMAVVFMILRGMSPTGAETTGMRVVEKEIDYTKVLAVAEPMNRGDRVEEGDLTWIDWPTDALTPALIVETSEDGAPVMAGLIGAVVREPLVPGDPLVMSRFVRAGDAGIMAALLEPGMRAVTVRISVDTASGGFIQPGDRVDIILQETVQPNLAGAGSQPQPVASTIFENVKVLAIDQAYAATDETGAAIPGSTATLELSPRDAERITVAQVRGDLSLVLRGFAGATAPAASRANQTLDGGTAAPALTVYRSGNTQTVAVREN